MPRSARIVIPGIPHHITQRGSCHQRTFFSDDDYLAYIDFMAESCTREGFEVWAYCLMPNHVHLIGVPAVKEALRHGIGGAHGRYSRHVNSREGWRGRLWQERFRSFPMDDTHLSLATRYVELNPVRAGIARAPGQYRWSSAAAHLTGKDDQLVQVKPLLDAFGDWNKFLSSELTDGELEALRRREDLRL